MTLLRQAQPTSLDLGILTTDQSLFVSSSASVSLASLKLSVSAIRYILGWYVFLSRDVTSFNISVVCPPDPRTEHILTEHGDILTRILGKIIANVNHTEDTRTVIAVIKNINITIILFVMFHFFHLRYPLYISCRSESS